MCNISRSTWHISFLGVIFRATRCSPYTRLINDSSKNPTQVDALFLSISQCRVGYLLVDEPVEQSNGSDKQSTNWS